jgi:hypothetical protein
MYFFNSSELNTLEGSVRTGERYAPAHFFDRTFTQIEQAKASKAKPNVSAFTSRASGNQQVNF